MWLRKLGARLPPFVKHRSMQGLSGLHIVIGNEACDADSAVSAYTYGHYLREQYAHKAEKYHVLPVISCTKDDFTLRREAKHIFDTILSVPHEKSPDAIEEWSFGKHEPLFLGNVWANAKSIAEFSHRKSLRITLVDHNEILPTLFKNLEGKRIFSEEDAAAIHSSVYEIVDHHYDFGKHPQVTVTSGLRCVEFDNEHNRGVGSTCTIVAKKYIDLSDNGSPQALSQGVCHALLAVILLDTAALSVASGKTTELDIAIANSLIARLTKKHQVQNLDIQKLYQELISLKTDRSWWRSLSIQEKMKFDYKGFTTDLGNSIRERLNPPGATGIQFGTSSVCLPLEEVFALGLAQNEENGSTTEERVKQVEKSASILGLDFQVFLSLVISTDDGQESRQRQLALIPVTEVGKRTVDLLHESRNNWGKSLDLEPRINTSNLIVYDQRNLAASRKQVVPLILGFLQQ